MLKPLLIEIGVEELPAIPFLKELDNLEPKWEKILEDNSLLCNFEIFYTPRRITLWHREFSVKQSNKEEELFGAPIAVAFKDGEPTKAGLGFAKKCGVDISEVNTTKKGNKEVLYYKKEIEGRESKELIGNMVESFIKSLNFGKSMRWIDKDTQFIRPIRWISSMLGEEIVEFETFGVKSSNITYPHRQISYEPFKFDYAGDYFCNLEKNGVILYQDERKKRILNQFIELENQHNIKIEIDEELLAEIVTITEYPTALIGEFDEEFLRLPKEVIITSMKEHQRYFAVYKDDKITNKFIVVSNANTNSFEKITKGNEKVLRARLSDGLFFYDNDLKNGFNTDGLKKLVFVAGLGTMEDKVNREVNISEILFDKYWKNIESSVEDLKKAVKLAKADLMTEMVYEFTELQGLMGYYYAKAFGENQFIYNGIKEQYLPIGEESELPSSYFSSMVALSYKLDNIMALFSINRIPTGSKDPFALRRSAIGVIRIVLERELNFNLNDIISRIKSNYKEFDTDSVIEFFLERIYQIFNDINPSIIKAVIDSGERDVLEISKKVQALTSIVESDSFKEVFTTFKRVANITKDVNMEELLLINETLFEKEEEKALFNKFNKTINTKYENYEEDLDSLFNLKPELDSFFDNVMVNVEDEKIKGNRKNLIASIYKAFKKIADIKEISI